MNNIQILKDFIVGKIGLKLIVNQVNEEIGYFYVGLIKTEAPNIELVFNYQDNLYKNSDVDLFGNEKIDICFSSNKKNIEKYLNSNNKCIIFTDYKNFKNFSSSNLAINGYNYHKDIEKYVKESLQINNLEIIDFCTNNPYLAFSEISKYLVNSSGYVKENQIKQDNNFILEIRKNLFNLKRNGNKALDIYNNLKKEVKYKKFSFLTY